MESLAIEVEHLNFSFGGPPILEDVNFTLSRGSRCLLVGHNGAGKSTLLRIIAGKHLISGAKVLALGSSSFDNVVAKLTYLGTEWCNNPVVRQDVPVARLLKTLGAERNRERCEELLEIMDVNPHWHMHSISDGQRRRVQIVLGLMEPWDLLLLDEVTVDLDVLVRADLLAFLKRETEQRGATILYATHIFDGLGEWPTHISHMSVGKIVTTRALSDSFPELEAVMQQRSLSQSTVPNFDSPLLTVVERWLRNDYELSKTQARLNDKVAMSRWEILSENMKEYGDKFYNYWR